MIKNNNKICTIKMETNTNVLCSNWPVAMTSSNSEFTMQIPTKQFLQNTCKLDETTAKSKTTNCTIISWGLTKWWDFSKMMIDDENGDVHLNSVSTYSKNEKPNGSKSNLCLSRLRNQPFSFFSEQLLKIQSLTTYAHRYHLTPYSSPFLF